MIDMFASTTQRALVATLLIIFCAFAIELLTVDIASAQCTGAGGFVPLECFQGSRKLTDAYQTGELGPFMNKVFVGAISLGAILAVLRLAWAGFVYMSTDLPGMKSNAKEIIWDTLLGLFLLLAIWLILNQINPDILSLEIDTRTPQTSCNGGICGGEKLF